MVKVYGYVLWPAGLAVSDGTGDAVSSQYEQSVINSTVRVVTSSRRPSSTVLVVSPVLVSMETTKQRIPIMDHAAKRGADIDPTRQVWLTGAFGVLKSNQFVAEADRRLPMQTRSRGWGTCSEGEEKMIIPSTP